MIHVTGATALPKKIELLAFDEAHVDDGATWVVVGDKTSLSQIVVDMDAKRLVLKTAKGSVFIMR